MPAAATPRPPTPCHCSRPRSHRFRLRYFFFVCILLSIVGCAILDRYILVPKQDLTVTPAQYRIPYHEVWFKTRDGVELNGWFLPGEPGRPLVLLFHGNAGNLSDNLGCLRLLHNSGLPLFIFDYRGFGRSNGEAFKEKDFYRDARGALAYLGRQGWSRDRIIFFGQSLGAAVALQMALEGKPAGLVMEGSFTSMEDMVKHVSRLAYFTVGWWGVRLSFDNFHKIDRAGVPLLLIHGDRDPVTPVEMSRRLYLRAGSPKMLHIVAGGGHCDAYQVAPASYLAAWQSYLLSIPAAATAAAPPGRS